MGPATPVELLYFDFVEDRGAFAVFAGFFFSRTARGSLMTMHNPLNIG